MPKTIKVPIVKMIDLLKQISSGGAFNQTKSNTNNTSKISFIFKQEISMFYTHFELTRNLLTSKDLNSAINYQIFFKKNLTSIFSLFFKLKMKPINKRKKLIGCVVKNLPNYKLYIKTKKIISSFMQKEESKFNLSKIKKDLFILNSLFDTDDENEAKDESKKQNNICFKSVNNNLTKNNSDC